MLLPVRRADPTTPSDEVREAAAESIWGMLLKSDGRNAVSMRPTEELSMEVTLLRRSR